MKEMTNIQKQTLAVVAILFLFLHINIAFASNTDTIDSLLKNHMKESSLPGMAVGVIKNNEINYKKTRGVDGHGDTLTTSTPMFIGSLSKSMTALAVMQLVEEDLVSLDDPIKNYIPYFQVQNPELSKNITVRNLLNHESGLANTKKLPSTRLEASLQERIKALSNLEEATGNGEEYHYFNDNYNLLGLLIEEVTGKTYATYMKDAIFTPLGMDNTTADLSKIKEKDIHGYTTIFGFSKGKELNIPRYDIPAGFILSNLNDMTKYLSFLIKKDHNILSNQGFEQMRTASENSSYGMGWNIREVNGKRLVEHSGTVPGFNAHIAFIPETKSGYIYIINQNYMFGNIKGNLLKVITNQTDFKHFPYTLLSRIIAFVILILMAKDIWNTIRLVKAKRSKQAWIKEGIKSLLLGLFLSLGLPLILTNFLHLTVNFKRMLIYTPDLALFWIVSISIQVVNLSISLWQLYRTNDKNTLSH